MENSSNEATDRPSWHWLVPIPVIAVLFGLALTQCGGDGNDPTASAPTPSSNVTRIETTAPPPETTAARSTQPPETSPVTETSSVTETSPVTETTIAVTTTSLAPASPADIVTTASRAANLSTLVRAIEAAGLSETLRGDGPFTLLAPEDAAFAALPAGAVDALIASPEALQRLLGYHLLAGRSGTADLKNGNLASVEGANLRVKIEGTSVTINDANVVSADLVATNGVIHVLGAVLLPPGFELPTAPASSLVPTPSVPEELTVYFASGSAAIDADADQKIERAIVTLTTLPDGTSVRIVGHADSSGNAGLNLRLSAQRAEAVLATLRDKLRGKNLTLSADGRGAAVAGGDPAKSRRVTIEIVR